MKFRLLISFALLAGVLTLGGPAFAHHGSNNYNSHTLVTFKGTVTQFAWSNPHCQVYFDVTDDKGNVEHWGAEMNTPHAMSMLGFSKDILKPGDKITITGNPAKSGEPRMFFHDLRLPNGKTLSQAGAPVDTNGNPNPPAPQE